MKDNAYFESIRKQYKPKTIKTLFIGESRPTGGTFFYEADSILYNYLKAAFDTFYSRIIKGCNEFFTLLVEKGIYLDDLCLEPVDKLSDFEKEAKRKHYIDSLANRIAEYKPRAIVIVLKGIKEYVYEAIQKSNIKPQIVELVSFPAYGQRDRFKTEIQQTLEKLKSNDLI